MKRLSVKATVAGVSMSYAPQNWRQAILLLWPPHRARVRRWMEDVLRTIDLCGRDALLCVAAHN